MWCLVDYFDKMLGKIDGQMIQNLKDIANISPKLYFHMRRQNNSSSIIVLKKALI